MAVGTAVTRGAWAVVRGRRAFDQFRRPRTLEELGLYYALQETDQAVVDHLRASIAEFKAMLEARSPPLHSLCTEERLGTVLKVAGGH